MASAGICIFLLASFSSWNRRINTPSFILCLVLHDIGKGFYLQKQCRLRCTANFMLRDREEKISYIMWDGVNMKLFGAYFCVLFECC